MTVNNLIHVIIALQESTTVAAARCRDDGPAIREAEIEVSALRNKRWPYRCFPRRGTWRLKAELTSSFEHWEAVMCAAFPRCRSCAVGFLRPANFLKFASPLSPRPWFVLAKCWGWNICNSKLARSNVITLFCHPQIWISQWAKEVKEGRGKK